MLPGLRGLGLLPRVPRLGLLLPLLLCLLRRLVPARLRTGLPRLAALVRISGLRLRVSGVLLRLTLLGRVRPRVGLLRLALAMARHRRGHLRRLGADRKSVV